MTEHQKNLIERHDAIIRKLTIDECKRLIQEFYIDYIKYLPEDITLEQLNDIVLYPSNEINRRLDKLKDNMKGRLKCY